MAKLDCCIAGCGPAGAMLGLMLARAGVKVAVFEKHSDFLRDFRGDTVHPTTLEVLDALGLAEKFLALPHKEVRRGVIDLPGRRIELDLTRIGGKFPFIALVPQWDFLDFITEQARAYPQFCLQMDGEVTGLVEENGLIVGLRWRGVDGIELTQRATLTIAADGRSSRLREAAGLRLESQGSALDVLWFRIPRVGDTGEPFRLKGAPGLIVAFFPRGGFWQVGYVIPKGQAAAVRARGIARLREEVAALAPELKRGLSSLTGFDHVPLLSVRADRLERWWRPGFLAIGDAAHAMSPIGGVGINLAIQDAVAAANVLVPAFKRGVVGDADLAQIQRLRSRPTRMVQRLQRYIERGILEQAIEARGPFKLPLGARIALAVPGLRELPLKLMMRGLGRPRLQVAG